ncbi:T9SS type A sorting domain-containing protein, partial [Pontibacter aydingkolensis]
GAYTVGVRRTADITCTNSASTTIIAPAGAPAAPVLSLTQPTCTVGTGAITLTPVSGMEYRLDDGAWGAYPSGGWSSLAPGSHTVYIRRISDPTCVNSSPALINDAPIVPSGIVVSRTHPTCTVATGSFTVTSPVGAIYSYSINGTDFQASPTFSGLAPGTYNLTVKSTNGCVSAAVPVVINDAPIVPSGVMRTVVQPTCAVPTGSITFTAPLGGIYSYSINNGTSFQASPAFSGLAPGTYNLVVRSSDGCLSTAIAVTLVAPVCDFEGCTLGYWKNHTGSWACYTPNTLYSSVFTSASSGSLTLLQALNAKGGGINNLYRQSVAAILNACHPHVNYELSSSEIIRRVNAAFAAGTKSAAGDLATYLDGLNNAGCSIDAHNRPISSSSSSSVEGLGRAEASEMIAYPTPFSDKATIEFTTAVDENYSVRLYDMKGALIKELKSGQAKAGVVNQIEVDGRSLPEGLYLARMVSDSGARTVKLLLKK